MPSSSHNSSARAGPISRRELVGSVARRHSLRFCRMETVFSWPSTLTATPQRGAGRDPTGIPQPLVNLLIQRSRGAAFCWSPVTQRYLLYTSGDVFQVPRCRPGPGADRSLRPVYRLPSARRLRLPTRSQHGWRPRSGGSRAPRFSFRAWAGPPGGVGCGHGCCHPVSLSTENCGEVV